MISPDTYFSSKDLDRLIKLHNPGTISWGVCEHLPEMEDYYGLVVESTTGNVLGDVKLDWWKGWSTENTEKFVKGAIHIIDPVIYMRAMESYKRICGIDYPIDLYWGVLPCIEERNRRLISRGKGSFLQALVFEKPIVDYGTPERLEFTRKIYENV